MLDGIKPSNTGKAPRGGCVPGEIQQRAINKHGYVRPDLAEEAEPIPCRFEFLFASNVHTCLVAVQALRIWVCLCTEDHGPDVTIVEPAYEFEKVLLASSIAQGVCNEQDRSTPATSPRIVMVARHLSKIQN